MVTLVIPPLHVMWRRYVHVDSANESRRSWIGLQVCVIGEELVYVLKQDVHRWRHELLIWEDSFRLSDGPVALHSCLHFGPSLKGRGKCMRLGVAGLQHHSSVN